VEANLILKKMKKKFLNFGLLLALGLTTTVLNSCDKDDDNNGSANSDNASKITATNVACSSTQIKTAKATAYWESGDDYSSDVIAQAPYQNNGFILELPATLGDKYLFTIDMDDMEGIYVSENNFKSSFPVILRGYNGDDNEIGYFYLAEINWSWHETSWIFVDRDVTIKGENVDEIYGYKYIEKYDLTLKKGWNIMYSNDEDKAEGYNMYMHVSTYSSKKPSEVNYTWYFYHNCYDNSSANVVLKPAKNSKLFSSKLRGNKGK
jgi:hypothetical protein